MAIAISLLKIVIFLFILFIPKISKVFNFILWFFPDVRDSKDESYKTALIIIMNTLLITSFTIAFSWLSKSETYSKYYYVFLILTTTITKWQYENLFYQIVVYQSGNKAASIDRNPFASKNMSDAERNKIKQSISENAKECFEQGI